MGASLGMNRLDFGGYRIRIHRRSQEFVLGAQCWICQIFPGGRIEAPKAPIEVGVWRGVSPPHSPLRKGPGVGAVPPPSKFFYVLILTW